MAEELMSGQEGIKPLSTTAAETPEGTLVRPKEPVDIVGTEKSLLGNGVKHTVHRMLAEKLVNKGQAEYVNDEDKPKKKSK